MDLQEQLEQLEQNWRKAEGPPCPFCGREALRLINGRCPMCHQQQQRIEARRLEVKARTRELRQHVLRLRRPMP